MWCWAVVHSHCDQDATMDIRCWHQLRHESDLISDKLTIYCNWMTTLHSSCSLRRQSTLVRSIISSCFRLCSWKNTFKNFVQEYVFGCRCRCRTHKMWTVINGRPDGEMVLWINWNCCVLSRGLVVNSSADWLSFVSNFCANFPKKIVPSKIPILISPWEALPSRWEGKRKNETEQCELEHSHVFGRILESTRKNHKTNKWNSQRKKTFPIHSCAARIQLRPLVWLTMADLASSLLCTAYSVPGALYVQLVHAQTQMPQFKIHVCLKLCGIYLQ